MQKLILIITLLFSVNAFADYDTKRISDKLSYKNCKITIDLKGKLKYRNCDVSKKKKRAKKEFNRQTKKQMNKAIDKLFEDIF